ncbi:hypothetical protein [Actinoplanes sp. GCM10030250]|uniref:hypothetical protein n=1 Tax=Actinoplanes sp. GCM10030250 TaxID=3273376 RepID=UPI00361B2443
MTRAADTQRHAGCFTEPVAATRLRAPVSVSEVVLKGEADLRRTSGWLTRLLVFDRDHGCWMLLIPGQDHTFLRLDHMNQQLRTPSKVEDARRWVAQLLEREDAGTRHEYGDSSAIPLEVTAWQQVRYAALHGYAPLTNRTPRCEMDVDLDPATGRDCLCQSATTSMVSAPGISTATKTATDRRALVTARPTPVKLPAITKPSGDGTW